MPELPEVETVRRGLARVMEGHMIAQVAVRRSDLRRPLPADFAWRLSGARIAHVGRRAKYLVIALEGGGVLLAHLGMSGRMAIVPPGAKYAADRAAHDTHAHVIFTLDDGTEIRFSDPRRFGLMDLTDQALVATHPLLANIGPEPLGNDFNGPYLTRAFAGKKTPVKAALLDQRVVAGLGNIYVCESLFRAGISPRRLAGNIGPAKCEKLATAIRAVLAEAIEAGGSSLRDHATPTGELGYFQHHFAVYGREGEPCPGCDCDEGIKRIVQSGRSTFYCPKRQR